MYRVQRRATITLSSELDCQDPSHHDTPYLLQQQTKRNAGNQKSPQGEFLRVLVPLLSGFPAAGTSLLADGAEMLAWQSVCVLLLPVSSSAPCRVSSIYSIEWLARMTVGSMPAAM